MAEHKKEIDQVTGVETTGHEWDGLKELNHPLPKWWLYMFYGSIVWAVIYWILMPSWPLVNGYTKGLLDYSQRAVVTEEFNAAAAERAETGKMLLEASLDEIQNTPELLEYAMAQGKVAFGDNCAACHGVGATGFEGYPNLQDDSWIWGGDLETLATTIAYGVRADNDETRYAEMPAFGRDELLEKEQIVQVANYVGSLAGIPTQDGVDLEAGKVVYEENCAACHMDNGKGDMEMGAPNLTAPNYLYDRSIKGIEAQINTPRHGVMPAWIDRLGETTVKSLAVYVHSRGGGQ
ncbi:Cbb3-type cytochrome c oxidase subunit FixP [Pseudovibrio japonicus]|uniref:Cbb3-type cytochrome c oxidase subunit n=1 Tax=Pseudovibrio japonicus TaxID=366534 RepID=A0ABQ3DYK1_9HYPH|nr:cytochrome-c oxidase, cbb3-type subunit III [Pseudovibrio japonicus]GHB20562.1 Cbb3-type cytochrome c oxidase subunit FixP [Pseudovibrio japonicus]